MSLRVGSRASTISMNILDARLGEFDAVAITSVIELPRELHENYYRLERRCSESMGWR